MSEQFHFESGQWFLEKGHYDAAVRHFERLLSSAERRNRLIGLFLLAEAHRLNSNLDTAIVCYEEALRMPADDIDTDTEKRIKDGASRNLNHCKVLKSIPCPLNYLYRPKRLLIEPVNVCNYSCYKCLYPQMKRKKTWLDPRQYEVFLDNWARRCGAFEEILFTGGGEALLHKNLKELILISKKHMNKTKLTVGSNLALLTQPMAKELIEAGLNNWEVSFDTVHRDEHLRLTGKDTFDIVLSNIKMLWRSLGEGSRGTLEVAAHRPFDKDYKTRVDEIEKMVRGNYSVFRSAPYTTLMRRNLHPGLELFEDTINYDEPCGVTCLEPWDFLIVTADGSVRRCCSDMFDCPDEETLGNVFTQDIDEIIRNGKRREIQKKLAEHDIGDLYICHHCYALFKHTSPFIVNDKSYD
jgi:hypothetical protein